MGAEFVSGHGADLSQRCGKSRPVASTAGRDVQPKMGVQWHSSGPRRRAQS